MTSFEAKKRRRVINDVERKILKEFFHDQLKNENKSFDKNMRCDEINSIILNKRKI